MDAFDLMISGITTCYTGWVLIKGLLAPDQRHPIKKVISFPQSYYSSQAGEDLTLVAGRLRK